MSRVLETSGFLGLTVMMVVGLYMNYLNAAGDGTAAWMIGGHAHLGVLSILAIAIAFVIAAYGIDGTIEQVVTWTFVLGQWGLPLAVWLAAGFGLEFLYPTAFLWGLLLVISMAIMTWQAAIQPAGTTEKQGGAGARPADD